LADFKLLEDRTGLKAGVASIEEKRNAINMLQNMDELQNGSIEALMNTDLDLYKYVYPNSRVIDDIRKADRELTILNSQKYNNVFYDPASNVELNWQYNSR